MRRWFLPRWSLLCLAVLAVTALGACEDMNAQPTAIAQFWRPISEPNILMPTDRLQTKLSFDLNQCHCGSYPANATHTDIVEFQPDRQRLAETGVTITPDQQGQCIQQPSLVVTECMRMRGWEPTNCSGRMPLPGGGSLCAAYATKVDQ